MKTSQPQTPQTKTLKRSEGQVGFVSPKTSELHEVGLDSRFLTDKTGESLRAKGCGVKVDDYIRKEILICGECGFLCGNCKLN
jgi:hypothetical protein